MLLFLVHNLIVLLILAEQNAASFAMFGETKQKQQDRWHRDNVILHVTAVLPLLLHNLSDWAWLIGGALLLRAALFDIAFNYFAKLNYHYIGSTAGFDKIFRKIFGVYGATRKAGVFLLALLILITLYYTVG